MKSITNSDQLEFVGRSARMWHFTASHDMLTYRIDDCKDDIYHYIVFLGCEKVCSKTFWNVEDPKVKKGSETEYLFFDEGMEIHCEEILLLEENEFEFNKGN